MDTTETNIKMCEKAEEIQKLRPSGADIHDYFWCPVHGLGCDLDNAIWLPLQHQLQEMAKSIYEKDIQESINFHIVLLDDFQDWVLNQALYTSRQLQSMEQLWLAFVMKEKYNKVWDGDKWENDNTDTD